MTVSPSKTTPLRWAVYCRSHNSASCQAQLAECLCAPHRVSQLIPAPEVSLSDADLSGRTNLTQLLEMAKRGEIDLLVVPGVTRIARSSLSVVEIADALKDARAGLYSLDEGWFVHPAALTADSPLAHEGATPRSLMSRFAIPLAFGL